MQVHRRWSGLLSSVVGLLMLAGLTSCATGSHNSGRGNMDATTGPVVVTTNLSAYGISDAIGVTVTNNAPSDYFATSGKSACVIIQLERYNTLKAVWEPVDGCAAQEQNQTFAIAKNSEQQFTLAPNSSADPNAWQPGLYRITLMYSSNPDGSTNAQQARCVAFNVR
jgi:hypothetical protein